MTRETVAASSRPEVSVTVRVPEPGELPAPGRWMGATVTVRCLPGWRWWTCPDARELRAIVDGALPPGWRRDGARIAHTDGPLSEWRFTYPLRRDPASVIGARAAVAAERAYAGGPGYAPGWAPCSRLGTVTGAGEVHGRELWRFDPADGGPAPGAVCLGSRGRWLTPRVVTVRPGGVS